MAKSFNLAQGKKTVFVHKIFQIFSPFIVAYQILFRYIK